MKKTNEKYDDDYVYIEVDEDDEEYEYEEEVVAEKPKTKKRKEMVNNTKESPAVKSVEPQNVETESEKSSLPVWLYGIGSLTMFGAFLAGASIGNLSGYRPNWEIALIIWASGLVSGLLFLSIGKVIELLVKLVNNTTK